MPDKKIISDKKKLFGIDLRETGKAKEEFLWHGTSSTKPAVIYQGAQEAFDITFSNVKFYNIFKLFIIFFLL